MFISSAIATAVERGWVGANLFWRDEPGHIADAPADRGFALRYALGF